MDSTAFCLRWVRGDAQLAIRGRIPTNPAVSISSRSLANKLPRAAHIKTPAEGCYRFPFTTNLHSISNDVKVDTPVMVGNGFDPKTHLGLE